MRSLFYFFLKLKDEEYYITVAMTDIIFSCIISILSFYLLK